jgi:TetR/AcrR family transcriptional repressor of nem operon
MTGHPTLPTRRGGARQKLLEAARDLIRERGFAATTVDDLCGHAGVTKGAFFHHFDSKEALGVAVAEHWIDAIDEWFENASYKSKDDPAARVLEYVAFRKRILDRSIPSFTCLVGAMASETYASHPAIRQACARTIDAHALSLVPDIQAALEQCSKQTDWSAESLALYIHCTLQGAFILAKAKNGPEIAHECFDHLARYLATIFYPAKPD